MIAQQILNGLIVGGVYALFALGLTLVFGIHKILNLAHGAVFMAGAFFGLYGVLAGLPLWVVFPLAMLGSGLLAVLIDICAFRALRKRGETEFGPIVASIGVGLVITSIAQRISNTNVMRFPFETLPVVSFRFAGLQITLLQLVISVSATLLIGLLTYFIYHTSEGRKIRAVASNERAAALCGVNPARVFFETFFMSGALAGAAGILVGLSFNSVHFLMGDGFMLRGFVVIVLGGLGSIPGALGAGMLLGIVQTICVAYFSNGVSDAIVFTLLFAVLVLRPGGLFNFTDVGVLGARR
ncbi:MAG TPA: branched-chain amino acid ABC transporter permease [Ramlibacter sp.]|nr:branched-chain amino acid ABC transporter permease [Ramlibacter sp.]